MRNPHVLRTFPLSTYLIFFFYKKNGTSYGLDIVYISSLYFDGVQLIPEKIKIQKYKKISKAHILRVLRILHFFDFLKKFVT